MTIETSRPRALSIHQKYLPRKIPARISIEDIESLLWCHPSARRVLESVFLPAQIAYLASNSFEIIESVAFSLILLEDPSLLELAYCMICTA